MTKLNTLTSAAESQCPATIGFRLDVEHGRVLAERAKTLGVSVHELARHYVLLMLHENDERSEVRDAIRALHQEIVEIRKDVVVSTEALLTSAGKVGASASRDWVRENLKIK